MLLPAYAGESKDFSAYLKKDFAEEYALNPTESQNLQFSSKKYNNLELINVTNPNLCSLKGCPSILYVSQNENTPKNVLMYKGQLKFTGPTHQEYKKINLEYPPDFVDKRKNKSNKVTYEFNEKKLTYIKK